MLTCVYVAHTPPIFLAPVLYSSPLSTDPRSRMSSSILSVICFVFLTLVWGLICTFFTPPDRFPLWCRRGARAHCRFLSQFRNNLYSTINYFHDSELSYPAFVQTELLFHATPLWTGLLGAKDLNNRWTDYLLLDFPCVNVSKIVWAWLITTSFLLSPDSLDFWSETSTFLVSSPVNMWTCDMAN